MPAGARFRRRVVALYLLVAACVLLADRQGTPASIADELLFISDADKIDASRDSNSVYRIALDGGGLKRLVGSIPHGALYLRIGDIDCHSGSGSLVIASHQPDLNGFYHALLDGTKLHLDKPAAGEPLTGLRHIALGPDGASLVVARRDDAASSPRYSLVAGDLRSRVFRAIKPATAADSHHSPAWSPAGERIAFISDNFAGAALSGSSVKVADADGAEERAIHESAAALEGLAWSPAGEWLAFATQRQIYKIRADGGGLTRLTNHGAGARWPRWSPDGRHISFVAASSFPGYQQLLAMDADGGNIRQVANIRGNLVNGCWLHSPA